MSRDPRCSELSFWGGGSNKLPSQISQTPVAKMLARFGLLLLASGSSALQVTQAPLVPGKAVTTRTAAPVLGDPLRASSLQERRKLKLETGV